MTLTHDDLKTLKAPFDATDHEFLNKRAYITESAITDRLEVVDPAWQFDIRATTERGITISVIGRLTLKGVTRENIGMAQVNARDDGRENNEAEKSAATDALKRCARLFGVGRYLLDLPGWVTDGETLAKHLRSTQPRNEAPAASEPERHPAPVTQLDDEPRELIAALVETKVYTDKKGGGERKRLVYHCAGDVKAAAFSTRAAKDAGYDVTTWGEVGIHEIVPPAVVTVKRKGDFWDAVDVRPSVALGATGTDDMDFLA